jgi:hypothetical protein
MNSGLTSTNVLALVIVGTTLFAGTNGGVFRSSNNGTSWSAVSTGLPNVLVRTLAANSTTLIAGTDGSGVWRRPLSELITDVRPMHGDEVPMRFALEQNYPNPFNPTTNIGFRISDFGFVSLRVFDVLGREVETLVNEQMQPGSYSVQLNANSLASGVYLCTMQTAGFMQTRKMLLMK